MLAKWEVKEIITQAFEELDGMLSKPDYETGKCDVYEAKVVEDDNGDLIFTFKEDCLSSDKPDKYRIKIEYCD